MCDPFGSIDEKGNATIICRKTGWRITISNEYGMYCANECDKQLDIEFKDKLENFLGELPGIFGEPK